jgi:hypothetical protein
MFFEFGKTRLSGLRAGDAIAFGLEQKFQALANF